MRTSLIMSFAIATAAYAVPAHAAEIIRVDRTSAELERFCTNAATRMENRFVRPIYDRCLSSRGFGEFRPKQALIGRYASGTRF